ncbi:tetratricopeptide repeat protein [Actinoplanes regularis]|uniref:tetratricopeptide repeat protein n=1 Tax=Actinoplanes regularis TaxID=52697 RepID=UPI002553DF52|nr:tetratricopeptide repeat protein [Actinoplanes regularis]GLW27896.1 hypothetical protein Areg01_08360 [Actinoplanes regularis]
MEIELADDVAGHEPVAAPRGAGYADAVQVGRVVGVEAPGRRGSGYLIAGRLVLTSAHTTPEVGAAVRIHPIASGRSFAGVVTWRGTPGGRQDAALVRVDDPAWIEPDGRDPAFGRPATGRPHLPAEAWGFPRWTERPEWPTDTWQVTGSVSPGSRFEGDRFVLDLAHQPPAGKAPWAGLPGGAVFCGGLLIGVVAGDLDVGPGQLEVVPVSTLCREPGFADAAGRAVPRLSPVELTEAQLTESDQLLSPAALLRAGAEIVGFRGRHRLMDDMDDWCAGSGFAALLLHGPGGQGKSRVGYELTAERTADGWATLWLDASTSDEAIAAVSGVVVPLLIVVDRADSRPEQVRTLLRACARHDGAQPLRLLLIARTAGDWWRLLRTDRFAEQLLAHASVVALPLLDDDASGQLDAYQQAVHELAAALPRVPGYAGHDWPAIAARLIAVSHEPGGPVLAVQIEALADLLDAVWPGTAASARQSAEDRVLAHERRYWAFTAAWHGLPFDEAVLQDLLAVAMLFSPADDDQADRLLSGIAALDGQPRECRDAVRGWLADLYPGTDGEPWGSLQPDQLAERFVGLRLTESPELPEPLVPVVTEGQRRRMLTVYARAARQPGLADQLTDLCVRHADRLTQATIDAAGLVETPQPLVAALRRISADPGAEVERLAPIGEWLPRHGHDHTVWAVEITQRIAELHRRAGREAELATALNNLSVRLGDLGSNGPALAAIEEAVLIHRRLAGQQPETFEADLARSLSNLCVRLGELGQLEPGLTAGEEATELYRRLDDREPGTFLPDLAMALRNLALCLGALERFPQALAAIEESVLLYQRLAEERPDEFLPDLAVSLSILGINLGSLDRDEESLHVAEQAVLIRRRLTAQRPDASRPGLATALTDLAVRHVVLNQRPEALAAVEEALAIRHRLVEKWPETFGEDLEWSLHVQKVILEA